MGAPQSSATAEGSELHVLDTPDALAQHVAQWMLRLLEERGGTGAIALAGGSTPRRLYEVLASAAMRDRFPWPHVHWFFGDERFVPHDHPDSNFHMVRETLLSVAPIPADNVHPIATHGVGLEQAAEAYEAVLKRFYGRDRLDPQAPLFDLTLLGVGDNGHTASLFPGDAALDERVRWVAGVAHAQSEPLVPRVTLTYPAIASSRAIAFLVVGGRKREIVSRVRSGDVSLPATRVCGVGALHWFVDRAAAPEP